ncbi:MAG: Rpn family recombination-promoting nuclease/putative transposase [Planctomycetaceae bacterium]|jgi:predicted transposase/invertase (TIGR01784 family)|nr:Rpn family recombination-promoting nuclease/putative transposase [Planctomycetaceae bacterium]
MPSRYINPYTDFGFKKLFGEEANKDLLIDFLNAVLPPEHHVKTLTFRNPANMPDSPLQRMAVFDIACRSHNNESFIVEMQKAPQHYFKDRSVFYSTFPIRAQAYKGDWNYNLNQIYFIAILNFMYDKKKDCQKFLREVSLKDQDGEEFYEKLQYQFFQMPLFTKTESELENRKDKWFYFLKNLTNFDDIPAILKEPIFERAFNTAEYVKLPLIDQAVYEHDLKIYRDNYSVLKTAKDDGIKKGIKIGFEKGIEKGKAEGLVEGEAKGKAEGLAEGEAKGKAEGLAEGEAKRQTEIARNLIQLGIDVETISKGTGLSIDEINKLLVSQ